MRIGFDARPLLGDRTGVSVWLEGLLRGLVATTDWHFPLFLPRRRSGLGIDDLRGRTTAVFPPVALPGTLWLQTAAAPLAAGRADVYVGTLGILPRRLTLPSVLVIHDLTPITRPHHHTLANRFCFNAYFAGSLDRAELLVCDSQATRTRLEERFPCHGRRASVIPLAADPFFSPAPDDGGQARRGRGSSGGSPFIVQLGTLEPRKGIATLVAAHGLLVGRQADVPDLVLAGGRGWGGGWLERALARHPAPSRVHVTGYLPRSEVRELLRGAELVVLAAEEEGFGLPLAEAFACGAACVASDEPALMELSRGAAAHFPRGDAGVLADVIEAALRPDRQEVLRRRSRERGRELDWQSPLAAWRGALAEVARGDSQRP